MTRLPELEKKRLLLFAKAAVFCTLVAVLIGLAGAVLKPARAANAFGGPWASFKSQQPNSIDLMVFGTSHAFTAVDPAVMWRENGTPTFVLAGPVQRMEVTKAYVREALKTQQPKVIAVELVGMSYAEDRYNSRFHLVNVGYMPMSENRLEVAALHTHWGDRTGVLVDLWAHHSRWTKLTAKDFDIAGKHRGYEYLRGYIPLVGVHGEIHTKEHRNLARSLNTTTSSTVTTNMESLEVIADECEKRDIKLLLFVAPTASPGKYNYTFREVQREMAKKHPDVEMVDFSVPGAVPGLVGTEDFYDPGHLNHDGSDKFGKVFARYLRDTYDLPDRRTEAAFARWNDDARARDAYVRKLESDAAKKR